jgi:beta-glucosidase
MTKFKFNDEFLLGAATSSTQIEGGDTNNTWYKWCKTGHILDSSSCITACDHWNRVSQDIQILRDLHVQTYRMSLEWSRIEPAPGQFSREAVDHYRQEIQLLLTNNIQPLVTLHHFSEPLWFQEQGGWPHPQNSELFIQYVKFVVENLGDLVSEWVTFNEPNVYVYFGYITGSFPPGASDIPKAASVITEIIKTHTVLYQLIHEIRKTRGFPGRTMVGAAIHIRVFDGLTLLGKLTARIVDYLFNELFMTGITTGRIKFPLPAQGYQIRQGCYADFLGINYYTRNIVEFAWEPQNYFHRFVNDKELDKSDLGWDIYPQGIYRVCKKYYGKFSLPVYITENGISDRLDNRRENFILDHLAFLAKAIEEGTEIKRYYHWSFLDNFEWLDGESAKFGLYRCDFRTQARTPRKSAETYAVICQNKEY